MAQTNSGLFANTAFQGAIAPSVEVQNPVQNNGMADAISTVGEGLQNAGRLFAANQANAQAAANDKVLVKFQLDVGKVTDAMEQGMSLQEGRMRLRDLNSQYISNYPSMINDLNQLQGKLVSTVGLANVIATGNENTQRANALADQASKAGWPSVQAYTNAQAAAHQADYLANQLKAKQAQYGLVTTADKMAGYTAVKNYIAAGQPWADARIDYYQGQIDNHLMSPDDAIAGLSGEVAKETATIGTARGLSGGADSDADPSFLLTGINDQVKAFTARNDGSITKDVYSNTVAGIKAKMERAILESNPKLARGIVLSNMIPPLAGSPLLANISSEALDYMTSLEKTPTTAVDPTTGETSIDGKPIDLVTTDGNAKIALQGVTASMKKMGANPTPEQQTSINNTLTNVFNSVKTYGGTTSKPSDMNNVMEFLADPTTNYWAVKNGGVSKASGDAAHYIVQQQYGETLLPLIQKRWEQAIVNVNQTSKSTNKMLSEVEHEPIDQVIVPAWNGVSMEFIPAPGLSKNSRVVAEVKSLNKEVGGVLNTYIRAMSTLQGSSDYQSFYNSNLRDRLFFPEKTQGDAK